MRKFFRENGGAILALILVGAFCYLFNLHGPLFWDDADWILNNFSVHALTWANLRFIFSHDVLAGIGQVSNYYRPFLFLTFLFNYLISGTNPISYHLVSDAIHITNGLLIFYLLCQWLKNRRIAFLAAFLFIIHPLQTEAVAYVSGRGDPLSVLFMLAGIALYVNNKKVWTAAAMILAILSRETAVLFPTYLGIVLLAFGGETATFSAATETPREAIDTMSGRKARSMADQRGEIRGGRITHGGVIRPDAAAGGLLSRLFQILKQIWPYLGISAIYGVLRLTVLNFQNTLNFYQQQNIYSEHLSYRLYTFFHALLVYLRLIFWPVGLHMDRDIPVSTSILVGYAWLGALIVIAAICWLFYLYIKERREESGLDGGTFGGRPGRERAQSQQALTRSAIELGFRQTFSVWFFGLGIFFVNLLPTSGIVPINARIYEHWLYFSLFGAFTVIAWYLDRLWSWLEAHRKQLVPPLVFALVGYSVFLGVQSIRRNILWTDIPGMYQNILSYQPDDVRVLNNLGNWDSDNGDNADAAPLYQRAIAVDPSQPAPYYNLGNIARDQGQVDEAISWYQKSLNVDPNFYYAYGNLASEYFSEKKYSEALAALKKLEALYPSPQTEQDIVQLEQMTGGQ